MDFLQMLIVLAVAAAVLCVIQIVAKAFVKETDDTIDDGRFNSRISFNKKLNGKMVYYRRVNPQPMRWLVFYSNILLPAAAISGIWCSLTQLLREGFSPNAVFYLSLAFTAAFLASAILIRGVGPLAFYTCFLPGIALLVCIIFPISPFTWIKIAGLVIFVPLIALNALYFIRRKELFLLNLAQIKQKVEEIRSEA